MKKQQGFTLIELIIVMILMAILAAIGVTSFMASQIKGRDSTRKGDLHAIANALELYYNDYKKYPLSDPNGNIIGCYNGMSFPVACTVGQVWQDANGTVYMPQLPKDPVSGQVFFYVSASGTQYQIYAHIENTQDAQLITPSSSGTSCGTNAACNWGLASANTAP